VIIFHAMRRLLGIARNNPLLLILLVGGLIRITYLWDYLSSPEWNQLLVDSLFHDRWAMSIAGGDVMGSTAYFRAPLYIYLLAGIYALFGHSLLLARIFGHLTGLLAVYLTYRITARLFSKGPALIAALIHSLYPIAIFFESELLVDSLFTMLVELSVLLFLVALEDNKPRWYPPAGMAIGLAAITRPVILAMVPLFMAWIIKSRKKNSRWRADMVIIAIFIILPILPVTIRNFLVADDLVLVSSSGGVNFYIGNNAQADGLSASMPPPLGNSWQISDIRYIAEKETGVSLRPSGISQYWYRKGLDWIISDKVGFAKLFVKKLYFALNTYEISNNRNLDLFFNDFLLLKALPFNFGIVFSIAVVSLMLLIRRRKLTSSVFFVLLFIIGYVIVICAFFINARFRLPIVPFLISISSYGIYDIAFSLGRRRLTLYYIPAIAVGLAAYAFSDSNFYHIRQQNMPQGLYNKANYLFYTGKYQDAISLYQQVLKSDPSYPEANLNLGAVYFKLGEGDSAEYYFNKELASFPENAKAYTNLASLDYSRGEYTKALKSARKAVELKPYFVDANLITLRIMAGLNDETGVDSLLGRDGYSVANNPRFNLEAGLIFSRWQIYDRSLKYLKAALNAGNPPVETDDTFFSYEPTEPTSLNYIKSQAAYQMGYIYGIMGKIDSSIIMSSRAIELDSNLVEAYVNLANAYALMGERTKALSVLTDAARIFPHDPLIKRLLDKIK
jgi:tetratricopeptide (TPR) repeat protein